jgi:hypothetical protein
MYILFDNIAATLMASVLVMLLIVSTIRQQQMVVESTMFYQAITQTEGFAQTLQRDLQGMTEVYTPTETTDSLFRFQGRIANDPNLREITYRREFVRDRDTTAMYRIVRYVDGDEAGGSADLITEWTIEARTDQGQPIPDPSGLENARQIYVRLVMAPAVKPERTVDRLVWESTFYPPLRSSQQLF